MTESEVKKEDAPVLNHLKIDIHEPLEVAEQFMKMGFDVEICTLPVGDYQFYEVGIERKASDFIDVGDVSMKCDEMRASYPHHYLIVEGTLGERIAEANRVYKRNMTATIQGLVSSLTVRGIPPIFCGDQYHMVNIMAGIFRKTYDKKDRASIVQILRPQASARDEKVRALMGMKGIGQVMAERLVEHFGSIGEIVKADIKDLIKIEGIGEAKAKKIKEVFR